MLTWWCVGVMSHDVVSAYFPDGGHIPGLHAWYFALPLLAITLAWPRKKGEIKMTAIKPKEGMYA